MYVHAKTHCGEVMGITISIMGTHAVLDFVTKTVRMDEGIRKGSEVTEEVKSYTMAMLLQRQWSFPLRMTPSGARTTTGSSYCVPYVDLDLIGDEMMTIDGRMLMKRAAMSREVPAADNWIRADVWGTWTVNVTSRPHFRHGTLA